MNTNIKGSRKTRLVVENNPLWAGKPHDGHIAVSGRPTTFDFHLAHKIFLREFGGEVFLELSGLID